jgi:hypothetical protein
MNSIRALSSEGKKIIYQGLYRQSGSRGNREGKGEEGRGARKKEGSTGGEVGVVSKEGNRETGDGREECVGCKRKIRGAERAR